jgi:hypothetical protein
LGKLDRGAEFRSPSSPAKDEVAYPVVGFVPCPEASCAKAPGEVDVVVHEHATASVVPVTIKHMDGRVKPAHDSGEEIES